MERNPRKTTWDLWRPVRSWLNHLEIRSTRVAKLFSYIPTRCPFERKISIGKFIFKIPALCHLNPVYEEIMELRYRALMFLENSNKE